MNKLMFFLLGMACATVLIETSAWWLPSQKVERSAELVAEPAPRAALTVDKEELYPIVVDYAKPIEEIIKNGDYVEVRGPLDSKTFSCFDSPNGIGVENVDVHLIRFKEQTNDYTVADWLQEHGLRPATVFEMATFANGYSNSDFARIVSVRCQYFWRGEREDGEIIFDNLALAPSGKMGKRLLLGYSDCGYHTDTWYAAVRNRQ